ncbi:hypothetical protein VCHC57A1_1157, partial [Vibrio cholerae HC-57A1]
MKYSDKDERELT